jgi:GxxExxY protein
MRQENRNDRNGMELGQITERVIGCALRVHKTLGSGFLEGVYQKALAYELGKAGMDVRCGVRLQVRYEGIVVGEFVSDMLIESSVMIENKAVRTLCTEHERQLINYLLATGIEIGLLLNFGSPILQIKRKTRTYRRR